FSSSKWVPCGAQKTEQGLDSSFRWNDELKKKEGAPEGAPACGYFSDSDQPLLVPVLGTVTAMNCVWSSRLTSIITLSPPLASFTAPLNSSTVLTGLRPTIRTTSPGCNALRRATADLMSVTTTP